MELDRKKYQAEIDGKNVDLYTIKNQKSMVVKITNWGAKVQQILVPDREGALGDVALGYESIESLRAGQSSMGAFIGRYANRIGQAKFTLNGREYRLAANSGPNSLHGGQKGSRFVVFDARQINDAAVQMTYVFKDGEENYPGTVPLRVAYSVTDKNEFCIEYDAVALDKSTVVNFTTHTFFNLAGQGKGDVLDHVFTINADKFTPVDETLIPTGEVWSVRDTPMDFTDPEKLGSASSTTMINSSSAVATTTTTCSTRRTTSSASPCECTSRLRDASWRCGPQSPAYSSSRATRLRARRRATSARAARSMASARGSAWNHSIFRIRRTNRIFPAQC